MEPLLKFRNLLAQTQEISNKSKYRYHRRRNGRVSFNRHNEAGDDKHIPGPYRMIYRKEWLKQLLEIEKQIRETEETKDFEIITRKRAI